MDFETLLSNADLTYLELAAKHAPQELGSGDANATGLLIRALIHFYATNADEVARLQDEVNRLEEELTGVEDELGDLQDEKRSLENDNEELLESVDRLESQIEEMENACAA